MTERTGERYSLPVVPHMLALAARERLQAESLKDKDRFQRVRLTLGAAYGGGRESPLSAWLAAISDRSRSNRDAVCVPVVYQTLVPMAFVPSA